MLFTSFNFIFVFLPIAVIGYYLLARLGTRFAVTWLVLSSLAFYSVWNPKFVILLISSIAPGHKSPEWHSERAGADLFRSGSHSR